MHFPKPTQKALVHRMVIPMRWGDMDAMGHVNNTLYFRFLETARIEWLRSINCQPDPKGEGLVILNAFCSFKRQLVYPGDLLVNMYASDIGEKTFETWATIARSDAPDVICAEGGATTVWIDFPAEKAKPMPQWLRAKLLAYLASA
jgi:acyl-CoA thioester hydrolase